MANGSSGASCSTVTRLDTPMRLICIVVQGADRTHIPTYKPSHELERKSEFRRDGSDDDAEL
jgi:hypothetical protein